MTTPYKIVSSRLYEILREVHSNADFAALKNRARMSDYEFIGKVPFLPPITDAKDAVLACLSSRSWNDKNKTGQAITKISSCEIASEQYFPDSPA